MSTFRFALVAVGLFALAFIGVSWVNKGAPVMMVRAVPLTPDARIPTFREAVEKGEREDWENSKTSQSDGNAERDTLRLELLQAANAYTLSPCDPTMKKNLVTAIKNYVNAWHAMAYCKAGVNGCPKSDDARLEAAAAAFKTPADIRVHKAWKDAIDQGGIWFDDFPASMREEIFLFTGAPFEDAAACGQTESARGWDRDRDRRR
jgi:hypothetical protein